MKETMATYPMDAPRSTMQQVSPFVMPNGEWAATVECNINLEHGSVLYAKLVKPPQTKEAADYLRSQGDCSD